MPTKHLTLPRLTPKQITRFWSKVRKGEPEECWPWIRACNQDGYGRVTIWPHAYQAHRIAYLLTRGAFPHELCVLHTCDNPACVNPTHLRLGTHTDNMRDREDKHRRVVLKGEAVGNSKLAAKDVVCIRQQYAASRVSQRVLALKYHVGISTISEILRRQRWKHVS